MSEDIIIDRFLRAKLNAKPINGYMTELANMRRFRLPEERYFELYLKATDGRKTYRPAIRAIYFSGRGKSPRTWMEVSYDPKVKFTDESGGVVEIDISGTEIEQRIFCLLSGTIAAGGRLMIEYSVTDHPETVRALEMGAPPILTKLGYLLWKTGFTSFKNWYFAEGWMEGNTKLQGEKPLNREIRRRQIKKLAQEVRDFFESGQNIRGLIPDAQTIYEELFDDKKSA